MRLTKEKLIALWRIRKQIFNNPINKKSKTDTKKLHLCLRKLQIVIFHLMKKLRSIP